MRRASEPATAWRRISEVSAEWIPAGPGAQSVRAATRHDCAAGVLPSAGDAQSPAGRGWPAVRDRLRARASGRMERALSVPGRRWIQRRPSSLRLARSPRVERPRWREGSPSSAPTADIAHPTGTRWTPHFSRDQQATIDFAYQAVDRVTAVAKAIIAQHYAQPISRSYYTGCSTGGREAMLAAQRYPLEFDGVIAGAPTCAPTTPSLASTGSTCS